MNERDEIEQLRFEVEQSTMKQEKKLSKPESRFKGKFKSFKKLPHSASANSAVEKARAFFRSFKLKRLNSKEQPSPSIDQHTTTNAPCSPSNAILINEDTNKSDSLLNPIVHTSHISIPRNCKVDKINPKDMIVYRILDDDQDDKKLPLNYFQQKYKQYLKPSLLLPKLYYNDLLNKRNPTYSTSINKHDPSTRVPLRTISPNLTYSPPIHPPVQYPTNNNEASPYKNRPVVCRQTESSFLVPFPHNQPASSIVRPLPSSSSISTWNQCVERLNTEYRTTINALQQAKEYLEEVYLNQTDSISKYANLVACGINNLSKNETKKSPTVTFCLPSPTISDRFPRSKSPKQIEQSKIFPSIVFCKPKLVKPIALNTFSPSLKLEPVLSIVEKDEQSDSIASIIKKFNTLSNSISSTTVKSHINEKQSIPDQSLSSKLVSVNEESQSKTYLQEEEETIYTSEILYKSPNDEHLIITRDNTTAEQFDLVYPKQHQEIQLNHISSQDTFPSSSYREINVISPITTPSTSLKNNNKFISQIPKRSATTTMHSTRLKQPSKLISSSTKLKPLSSIIIDHTTTPISNQTEITNSKTQPQLSSKQILINDKNASPNRTDQTSSISKNCVKSMVHQLNNNASSHPIVSSSIANKRTCRRVSIQPTIFTSENVV